MCQQDHDQEKCEEQPQDALSHTHTDGEPFPWAIGVFDAHCHPTDIMCEISSLRHMKTQAHAIMATRSQDQHLVAEVADKHTLKRPADLDSQIEAVRVIPSFGWHPWFSYQLYDDLAMPGMKGHDELGEEEFHALKKSHYQTVLQPKPTDDTFIASLPEPSPLSAFLASTRANLDAHPHALVGEVGLDKAFRLPQPWSHFDPSARDASLTPGGREGRLLSSHRVSMAHQQAVLKAQLRLAGEMNRAVSVHGVQSHGVLYETLASTWKGHEREVLSRRQKRQIAQGAETTSSSDSDPHEEGEHDSGHRRGSRANGKPFPPRVCLHSFSGGPEVAKQYLNPAIPCQIFFSFSTAVNMSTDSARQRFKDVLSVLPETSLLIESDLHVAGDKMDDALEDVARLVCAIRGWKLDDGVKQLRRNFEAFIFDQPRSFDRTITIR